MLAGLAGVADTVRTAADAPGQARRTLVLNPLLGDALAVVPGVERFDDSAVTIRAGMNSSNHPTIRSWP